MEFDEILNKIYMYDCEVTKYDNLFVFIKYTNDEKYIFHNPTADEINNFISKDDMILLGYNNRSYDKYILQGVVGGLNKQEIKEINDYIIAGHNGYSLDIPYNQIPPQMDLLPEIVPRKSLKELEGNLCMDITETTVDFNIDHQWTDKELEEMIYYCTKDVEALKPIFNKLMKAFKSKYIVAQICKLDPVKAMCMTNANITAWALGAEKKEHNDEFLYEFPDIIDKNKIPKEFLDYIQMCRDHNDDYEYIKEHPMQPIFMDGLEIQVQLGGIHGFPESGPFQYGENEVFTCE